jgi:hypothetical protein
MKRLFLIISIMLLSQIIKATPITNLISNCLSNSQNVEWVLTGNDTDNTNGVYGNWIGFIRGTNFAKSIAPYPNQVPIRIYPSKDGITKLWAEDYGDSVVIYEIGNTSTFVSNGINVTNVFMVSRDLMKWNTYILPRTGFRPPDNQMLFFKRRSY